MPTDKKQAQDTTGTTTTAKRHLLQAQVSPEEWSQVQALITETGLSHADFVRERCLKDSTKPPIPLANIKVYHTTLRSVQLLKALHKKLPQLQEAGITGPWDTFNITQLIEQMKQDALDAIGVATPEVFGITPNETKEVSQVS